jgi:hypothetical protein
MMPAATLAAWSDPAPGNGHESGGLHCHTCGGLGGGSNTVACECYACGRLYTYDVALPVFDLRTQRVAVEPATKGYIPFDFPPLVRGRDGRLTRARQFDLF